MYIHDILNELSVKRIKQFLKENNLYIKGSKYYLVYIIEESYFTYYKKKDFFHRLYKTLTVKELKNILVKRNLKIIGNKEELINRLIKNNNISNNSYFLYYHSNINFNRNKNTLEYFNTIFSNINYTFLEEYNTFSEEDYNHLAFLGEGIITLIDSFNNKSKLKSYNGGITWRRISNWLSSSKLDNKKTRFNGFEKYGNNTYKVKMII